MWGRWIRDLVEAVENHRFDPLDHLMWRQRRARLPPDRLAAQPRSALRPFQGLMRQQEAIDQSVACRPGARSEEIAALALGTARVRLLWEVCQVPDFRKLMTDAHARLLARVYRYLIARRRPCPSRLGRRPDRSASTASMATSTTLTSASPMCAPGPTSRTAAEWLTMPAYWQGRTQRDRGPALGRAARGADAALRRPPPRRRSIAACNRAATCWAAVHRGQRGGGRRATWSAR